MSKPILTLCKRAPDGALEIPVLGDIGFFGVDGADLLRELMAVKPSSVKFTIHSPGGAVYDAIAVAGYIREHGIECYAEIFGTCASAATVFAALAGPKRTSIAPGSFFMIHMPYLSHGEPDKIDQQAIDNAAEFCVNLYAETYGWTKAEARKYMTANDGKGTLWNTTEAKGAGIASEIMNKAKLAAHYNLKPTAMADQKKMIKATVKLTVAQAISAATGSGVEVEVEAEQATADALAEKDTRISQLETELAEAKAKTADEATTAEALTQAQQEAVQAKADLAAAVSAKDKAMADLKATHDAEIAALKAPLAKATVADNKDGAVAKMPGSDPSASDKAAAQFINKATNALERGMSEAKAKEKAAAK